MGKKHKNKQAQVNHVAKETGIDPKELDRLDREALGKIDDLVQSDDDLLAGDSAADHGQDVPSVSQELGEEAEGETSSRADGEVGIPEDGSVSVGEGSVDTSGVDGQTPDGPESETHSGSVRDDEEKLPELPTAVVIEEEAQLPPSETPKSPDEVETSEGQGDSSQSVPPRSDSGRVVGYHPVTGKKVYLDEQ